MSEGDLKPYIFFNQTVSDIQINDAILKKKSALICLVICRAYASFISFRGLHLHHSLCHSAVVARVGSRLLQGYGDGWQWHAVDVRKPGHQLSNQWTDLWSEIRGPCDTHVRELHEHAEHHLGHFSDRWDTVITQKKARITDNVRHSIFSLLEPFLHMGVHGLFLHWLISACVAVVNNKMFYRLWKEESECWNSLTPV